MLFDFACSRSGKQIGVVSLNAACRRRGAVVGVNRDEQVGLCLIGKIRALIERQIRVVSPREDYFRAQSRLQQLSQTLGHVEHQIFFQQSLASHRPQVPSAVTGDVWAVSVATAAAAGAAFTGKDESSKEIVVWFGEPVSEGARLGVTWFGVIWFGADLLAAKVLPLLRNSTTRR